jgi:hypothetical protein
VPRKRRAGDADAYEEAEDRAGDWKKLEEGSWRGYWGVNNKPDDAENWAAVEHNWGGSYHATGSDEALSDSNMAHIQRTVLDAFPDDVITDVRRGDFAIRALRPEDPADVEEGEEPRLVPTAAWAEWIGIENSLKNYPILDEDDFSERESNMSWEETKENIEHTVRNLEDFDLRDGVPDDWVGELVYFINENIHDYRDRQEGADGIDPKPEHVIAAMLELGYTKRLRDYFGDEDV